jgi:hypothetical protein
MSKKKQATRNLKTGPIIAIVLVIGFIAIGGWAIAQQFTPRTGTTLRDSDTAFSIATHMGQPAPEFTATGVDGQPYTFTPGDGRPKVIAFYMGFR